MKEIRTDCRHYRGEYPCSLRKVCWECSDFAPIPPRALVIKFGAPGDALRTTPLLEKLRKEGYEEITWICDDVSREILEMVPGIDRLVPFSAHTWGLLDVETFDLLLSLDKHPTALACAARARAKDKRGFGVTPQGRLTVLDQRSHYALRLGIDDPLKFYENEKTVPEILFEMCGYEFKGERYALNPGPVPERAPRRILLNIGVGPRWPTKAWPRKNWIACARLLKNEGFSPLFCGGPAEETLLESYATAAGVEYVPVAPLRLFAQTIAGAAAVVTADSLALHIALAVGTPVIGLFCSTTAREIEWYGIGEALVSKSGPCYRADCASWPECMEEIEPEVVLEHLTARLSP
ncbi:MAG: glycosyltransferase family 9 protein [Candidatus Hydrogenedentota bacterium]|nr:MAG: glycosyltransferase family 9 protein [Candidatus Hydrogenedentota bacterium]